MWPLVLPLARGGGALLGRAAGGGAGAIAGVGRAIGGIGSLVSGIADMFPTLEDEVTVEVVGQPGSNKRQLYYLAMATAYGLARPLPRGFRLLGPPPSLLICEYDAADSWVRLTLKYKIGVLDFATNPAGTVTALRGGLPVISGPRDEVRGGRAQLPLPGFVPGLPGGAEVINLIFSPTLEFTGRIILTSSGICETPDPAIPAGAGGDVVAGNPRPPGDTRSRGAVQNPTTKDIVANYLVPLIFSSLSDPGSRSRMYFPNPNPSVGGGG